MVRPPATTLSPRSHATRHLCPMTLGGRESEGDSHFNDSLVLVRPGHLKMLWKVLPPSLHAQDQFLKVSGSPSLMDHPSRDIQYLGFLQRHHHPRALQLNYKQEKQIVKRFNSILRFPVGPQSQPFWVQALVGQHASVIISGPIHLLRASKQAQGSE